MVCSLVYLRTDCPADDGLASKSISAFAGRWHNLATSSITACIVAGSAKLGVPSPTHKIYCAWQNYVDQLVTTATVFLGFGDELQSFLPNICHIW